MGSRRDSCVPLAIGRARRSPVVGCERIVDCTFVFRRRRGRRVGVRAVAYLDDNRVRELVVEQYGLHLANANVRSRNQKMFDLVDDDARVIVQVTLTCNSRKVGRTLADEASRECADRDYRVCSCSSSERPFCVGRTWVYCLASVAGKHGMKKATPSDGFLALRALFC